MGIFKILGFGILAIVVGASLSAAGAEGDSSLFAAVFWWFLAFAFIGWGVTAISRTLHKRRGEPISNDALPKRISDWLLENEPLVLLGYRVAIVLLLALGIDKIDRHTWSVANEQVRRLGSIEERLSTIEDHTSEIESNTSSIRDNIGG
jgi:hypothetical protein